MKYSELARRVLFEPLRTGGGQAVYFVRVRNAEHGFVADKEFEGV